MAETESLTALPVVEALRAVQAEMATLNTNLPVMTTQLTALNVNLAALQSADLQTILHDLALFLNWLKPKKEGLKMALKMQATGTTCTFDFADLKAKAAALGIDWTVLWADIQKYGPGFVDLAMTIAGDLISGSWMKAVTDLIALGPAEMAAVVAILKDLGINLPFLQAKVKTA